MNYGKSIKIAGNILMVLSFAFIIKKIIEYGVNFSKIVSFSTVIMSIISVFIYAVLVIALAIIFYFLLRIFSGNDISPQDSVFIYCKSNLYKYLPGNIFHYIGRNQIALNSEISHGEPVAATIAEMLLLSIAALVTAIVFAGQHAIKWSLDNYTAHQVTIYSVFIVVVLSAGIILYRVLSKGKTTARNIIPAKTIQFSAAIKILMVYVIYFVINGVMFILLLHSMGGELSKGLYSPVIGMYTLSWMIGFVTPGAPAGLGIREAIMSALLVGIVGAEFVISAVVIYRIITILGDVVAFIMVHQLSRDGICQRFFPSLMSHTTG